MQQALNKAWAPIFDKKHIDEEAAQQFVQQHVKQECFAEIIPVDLHHIENMLEKMVDTAAGPDGLPYSAWRAAGKQSIQGPPGCTTPE